jgi:peptidoglycan hydrolase-like protein with peptidoglycan-binding domain
MLVVAAVAVIALVIVVVAPGASHPGGHNGASGAGGASGSTSGGSGHPSHTTTSTTPLALTASTPVAGASSVPPDSDIALTFSSPVTLGAVVPTLSPAVAGSWTQTSKSTLTYDLTAPLVPSTNETVTIPGGSSGLRGTDGSELPSSTSFHFSVAIGDYLRLQQLLAQLDYLPVSFAATGAPPAGKEMATDQPGTFSFRWPTLPTELTSQWTPGMFNEITRAAVEAFENQNNLGVDGIAGPSVWSALLADVAAQKVDDVPYVYVLVTKVQPENLTLYNNGAVQFSNILVNTGAPGADTTDGTYAVFEHVQFSDMKGTNPDGTKYNDPNVPWASYFNGGDALHGFIRAHYGYPQSNGCVEMSYADAGMIWPETPIGTLVTIEGPATPAPPTTTTTTTVPPATTTTAPATPPTVTPTTAAA